jgi:S-methylmethionine-dependent homocysteine/selenocysteine methylase
MSYRDHLPQLDGGLYLTDGGIETTLIFHENLDLPLFSAFVLLENEDGTDALRRYYAPYLELAGQYGSGFVLESPTWRASPRWATELGYSESRLDELNRQGIALMEEVRESAPAGADNVVISGCVGPHDDGYQPSTKLSAAEARDYHATQISTFADTAADMVTAMTLTYADEAIGISGAAHDVGLPAVIAFTLETDGRLPSGQALREAIEQVDAESETPPAYYMINCAHPTHFDDVFEAYQPWPERIRAVRANASTKSHAELDESDELDEGDPADLGRRYAGLRHDLPNLNVLGGCCGTDHRHVAAACAEWVH